MIRHHSSTCCYGSVNKMEDDRGASFPTEIGDEFRTFEDYLDTQIKPLDLYYLQVKY